MCIGLSACMRSNITTPRKLISSDPAEVTLAEAAVSVSHSLQNLDEIKRANTKPSKRLVSMRRYRMPGRVSVDWSGPIEPILRRIVHGQGYRLRVIGVKPAIPVMVTLSDRDTPVTDVIRDIDFQAGSKASVRVFTKTHVVELRYVAV